MFPNMDAIREFCEVSEKEEDTFDITKDPFAVYLSGFDTRKMANRRICKF